MKLLIVACLLATVSPLLCSAASSYSSFWEYLLEREQARKLYTVGGVWSDCSKFIDVEGSVMLTVISMLYFKLQQKLVTMERLLTFNLFQTLQKEVLIF